MDYTKMLQINFKGQYLNSRWALKKGFAPNPRTRYTVGRRKLFESGAQLHVGKTDKGSYKVCVVGPVSAGGMNYWVEAGGGAWKKDPPILFPAQDIKGYSHPLEAIARARIVFPTRASFQRFIAQSLGSESTNLLKRTPPPTFDSTPLELWA